MPDVGSVIRRHRESAGLSQRKLGAAAGVSGAYISQLEAGAKQPSIEVLDRLAAALGTTASALLRRKPAATPVEPVDIEAPSRLPQLMKVHGARTLEDIEGVLHHPDELHRLVREVRSYISGPRGDALGAYMVVAESYADMVEAFANRRYMAMKGPAIVVVIAALSYVADPDDVWPDLHPHGHIDDVAILAFSRALVQSDLEDFLAWRDRMPQ